VPKSGGSSTIIASSGGTVRGIAVDSSYVYWANLNDLLRAPKSGGSASVLSNLADGSSIAVTSYDVYFADVIGGYIYKVPKTGGSTTIVASGQVAYSGASFSQVLSDLTGDNNNVVWTLDGNGVGTGAVRRASPFGGTVTTLASSPRPAAVALDGGKVYYADTNTGVYSRDLTGSSPLTITTFSSPRYVTDMAVDTSWVYVPRTNSSYTTTYIERAPKSGGALQPLSQASGLPGDLALDTQSLYFVAGDSIYRSGK
jgi:hypothetical protein